MSRRDILYLGFIVTEASIAMSIRIAADVRHPRLT